MSSWLRCNRCGEEVDVSAVTGDSSGNPFERVNSALANAKVLKAWTKIVLARMAGAYPAGKPSSMSLDLCEDCRGVFLEQFMKGASVAPITQPLSQVVLPHQPMTDCQLVWNPANGRFLCYHEDPELYHSLILDNAQNAAEGVPEKPVEMTLAYRVPGRVGEDGVWRSTETEAQTKVRHERIREMMNRMVVDVSVAAETGAVAQRCGEACSEQHTYEKGCLLDGVVGVKESLIKEKPATSLFKAEDEKPTPRLTMPNAKIKDKASKKDKTVKKGMPGEEWSDAGMSGNGLPMGDDGMEGGS